MGKYTALDDPQLEQVIEVHMQQFIQRVRVRMNPNAIILRGSFGRGEGSVLVEGGHVRFLSDYEVDVATYSPFYRSFLRDLSLHFTEELGVDTSLRWVRPDYLLVRRVGPFPMGPARPTISLYESRYGSEILYCGDEEFPRPAVDPNQIPLQSAIRLMLNRMAESLSYLPVTAKHEYDPIESYYWINKMILACSEALLVQWKQYHYSYAERGRRFVLLAEEALEFMPERANELIEMVARATEFKLQPRPELYTDSIEDSLHQLVPVFARVFFYLTEQMFGSKINSYVEFPSRYLEHAAESARQSPRLSLLAAKMLDLYKFARSRHYPHGVLRPFGAAQVAYSVVPLMYVGWSSEEDALLPLLTEIRNWLELIIELDPIRADLREEWTYLRGHVLWTWKNFVYS